MALSQFLYRVSLRNFCFVHVRLVSALNVVVQSHLMTISKENEGKGLVSTVMRVLMALVPWKSTMVVVDEEAMARQALAVLLSMLLYKAT